MDSEVDPLMAITQNKNDFISRNKMNEVWNRTVKLIEI